jgi:hypothetical protein
MVSLSIVYSVLKFNAMMTTTPITTSPIAGSAFMLAEETDNGDTYISLCGGGNGRWLAFQKPYM